LVWKSSQAEKELTVLVGDATVSKDLMDLIKEAQYCFRLLSFEQCLITAKIGLDL